MQDVFGSRTDNRNVMRLRWDQWSNGPFAKKNWFVAVKVSGYITVFGLTLQSQAICIGKFYISKTKMIFTCNSQVVHRLNSKFIKLAYNLKSFCIN